MDAWRGVFCPEIGDFNNRAIFALGETIRVHFYNPVCLVFPKLHTKKSRSRWARFMERIEVAVEMGCVEHNAFRR